MMLRLLRLLRLLSNRRIIVRAHRCRWWLH